MSKPYQDHHEHITDLRNEVEFWKKKDKSNQYIIGNLKAIIRYLQDKVKESSAISRKWIKESEDMFDKLNCDVENSICDNYDGSEIYYPGEEKASTWGMFLEKQAHLEAKVKRQIEHNDSVNQEILQNLKKNKSV